MATFPLDKVPQQVGYLVLNEDGAIIASGGELEYNEAAANIFYQMVKSDQGMLAVTDNETGFKRLSVNYDDHLYVAVVSNKKTFVVKRKYLPVDPAIV